MTDEEIKTARKSDLYNFLIENYEDQFDRITNSLRPKFNHSISIKMGYSGYYDFATGEKGNSIDFLTKYMDYSFSEAVNALNGESVVITMPMAKKFSGSLLFPEKTPGAFKHLFAYLMKRGITQETIQALIDQDLIYQEPVRNNIVFANAERDWGEIRGTYDLGYSYHGIVPESRHDGYFDSGYKAG